MRALFRGSKARVGVPSYICRSVYDAVCLAGCEPVLLDIDPATFSLSLDQARKAAPDAVVVAHMFGLRAPVEQFLAAKLVVIEDCAQRIAPPDAGRSEPRAPFRILSFEATKLLTCGEGGLLLCDDPAFLERARRLRDAAHDLPEPAVYLPLTDLQAAMALVQWERLPAFLERRCRLAGFYLERIGSRYPQNVVPGMRARDTYAFRFLLQVDDPAAFLRRGEENGVIFRRPVSPMPLHRLFPASGAFPVTDSAFAHLVSIPVYPRLTEEEAQVVAETAIRALGGR
jgi:dTDP-4-amino-4,6-dideoxygalactose transaminase